MFKQFVGAIVVAVVLTSGAWGFVGQEQGFNIGAANIIQWPTGIGSATTSHDAMFGHEQTAVGTWPSASGQQKETGIFTQTSSATGGPTFVAQNAKAEGTQQQATGVWSQPTNSQGQQAGVDFSTVIAKPGGAGAATATQGFVGGQVHTLVTPGTFSTESQVLGATEYASVVGGPFSRPTVTSTMKVDLGQGQLVTLPSMFH